MRERKWLPGEPARRVPRPTGPLVETRSESERYQGRFGALLCAECTEALDSGKPKNRFGMLPRLKVRSEIVTWFPPTLSEKKTDDKGFSSPEPRSEGLTSER